jgi:hypothetical protein
MGLVPAACDRVGETTGGAAHDERRDQRVSLCRAGLAPTVSLKRRDNWSGRGGWLPSWSCAVGGDGRVPGLAGGDHSVQVPQDRRGDDGVRLGWSELVVFPGGQVPVAGAVDGIGSLRAPDRAPGGEA